MILTFSQYLKESEEAIVRFSKDIANKIISKVKRQRLDPDSNAYFLPDRIQIDDLYRLDILLNIKKKSDPSFTQDSHFKNLNWEKYNFNEKGFAIDATIRMNKSDKYVPELTVHVIVDPNREPSVYGDLYTRFVDILIHEINHIDQAGIKRNPFNNKPEEQLHRKASEKNYRYFLLRDEMESMIEGFHTRSKLEDIPLDYVFIDYLQPFVLSKFINREEYQEVLNKWIRHAVERYPNAPFSQHAQKIIDSL